ncbi:Glycerophosphoryl diester phosphodiesterase family-domain-containing protein [Aspergillus terricola var. indicus]
MRFGHDFHSYQVPEWASSYIPYLHLKSMFNTAVRLARYKESQRDFTETLLFLERGIDAMSNFHRDKYRFLLKSEEEIRKKFGLPLERSEPSIGEHLDCCQLEELLSAIMEVNKDFQKLQWYFRVNAEAIDRIYSKIDRSGGLSSQLHQHKLKWLEKKADCDARCARDAEILTSLTTEVHRSLAVMSSRLTKSSAHQKALRTQPTQHEVIPDLLRCMVMEDQPSELSVLLEKLSFDYEANTSRFRELVYKLAELSVAYGSKNSKFGVDIDNGLLIRMILYLGEITSLCGHKTRRNELLDQKKKDTFLAKDGIGRTCLHYGALYGLHIICQAILEPTLLRKRSYGSCLILSVDSQGYTPLHYAVINNHTAITDMFLAALDLERNTRRKETANDLVMLLDELLFIAVRYQYTDMIYLLGKRRSGCGTRSAEGETALYVAARTGNEKIVEFLLRAGWFKYINVPETTRGWTPLVIACAQGHSAATKLLLQAGARQDIVDNIGWTAKEHAALRGHLCVSEMLDSWNTLNLPLSSPSMHTKPVSGAQAHLLPDYCHVIINLGAIQKGNMTKALVLNPNPEGYSCSGGCLSLEVVVSEGNDTGRTVELPILNDMVNEPFIFPVSDPSKILLAFKLYRACPFHEGGRARLGSGVALLSSLNDCFGTDRESLIRERTVPILEKDTLIVLGTVTFTFLIAKPMSPPNISARNARPFTTSSLQLVGHRGLGQNTANRSYLQLGENTMESFELAAKQGATYVELTRDLVPIIYHDFSLSESGTDIPIHDLTVEQFMCVSKHQLPRRGPKSGCPVTQDTRELRRFGSTHIRSWSLTEEYGLGTQEIRERLKHTVDFKIKGFKPNTRGDFIQAPFATLEDALTKLPESVGLNVEIKYPRIHEAAEAGVSPIAVEINTFVDKILEKILLHARDAQNVILSSFTPEVCILLAFKQRVYPVMFITNAGKPPVTDLETRASSLQSAVRFAKRWSLSGIIFASEALISCPRLIGYVKQSGLACGSYGLQNNIPENAKAQAAAGIDILMADRVGLISGALNDGGYL